MLMRHHPPSLCPLCVGGAEPYHILHVLISRKIERVFTVRLGVSWSSDDISLLSRTLWLPRAALSA